MGKIFLPDRLPDTVRILLDEDAWFERYQALLLGIVNTKFGRELLCIPKNYGHIVKMTKNSVHFFVYQKGDRTELIVDVRVGTPWGNIIRLRWDQFTSFARYFVNDDPFNVLLSPATRFARSICASTLTVYPQPNTETVSVDGRCSCMDQASWSAAHDATDGTSANDSDTTHLAPYVEHGGSGYGIIKYFALFDTSSLTASASISSCVGSIYIQSLDSDAVNDGLDYINWYSSSPASNTAISTADFDQCGTTAFCDTNADLTGIATGAFKDFTFNASGLAAISKTSITKLSMREGHDVTNTTIGASTGISNGIIMRSADYSDVTSDPKLLITYTVVTFTLPQIERNAIRGVMRGAMRP